MAKKKEEKKVTMTRAQKTEATKGIIKELLAVKPMKHNELIEETARLYAERYASEETENANDVKGRAGSVLDIMKKDSEVMYDGGMYALKARMPVQAPVEATEEKPVKKTKAKKETTKAEEGKEEKPAPKKRAKKTKTVDEPKEEIIVETPVENTEETPKKEEKPEPKKRGRKPKAKAEEPKEKVEEEIPVQPKAEEKPVEAKDEPRLEETPKTETKEEPKAEMETPKEEVKEQPKEEIKQEPKEEPKTVQALTVKPKAEVAPKGVVMDMTFLIGDGKKAPKKEEPKKVEPKKEEPKKIEPKAEVKAETPVEDKPKTENKPAQAKPVKETPKAPQKEGKTPPQKQEPRAKAKTVTEKPLTADEKLRDAYLKRMRTLGGDYFEYYSVYLLERYSMKNGRRLEGMRISGGGHDGGIDGEIELTDKFGFRETIYIQSKNWNPDKGKEESWVVGETLLQQFIGACACRQAKEGKQHCRGIFVTTSRFTPDAKRILEDMADKIVGYDGNDLYEAAKECSFGLVKKNGEWMLDEKLLSGTKAFFDML